MTTGMGDIQNFNTLKEAFGGKPKFFCILLLYYS